MIYPVSNPTKLAKVSPRVVSSDVSHWDWIWSMLLTTSHHKAKCLPVILRWLLKFGFVLLCLHFDSPLTLCFPFSPVLCHVLLLSPLFSPVHYVPIFPFLSYHSLLPSCRAPIAFPFTLPFAEPSHLLYSSFSFTSSFVKVLTQVSVSGQCALVFQRTAIQGSPAKPDHSLEKTDNGSRALSSFLFLVQCSKGEESWTERRAKEERVSVVGTERQAQPPGEEGDCARCGSGAAGGRAGCARVAPDLLWCLAVAHFISALANLTCIYYSSSRVSSLF